MATYTEEVGNKLNGLLEKNYDAEKGYKKAAENTKHTGLKTYFNRKAIERKTFGHDLKSEIRAFGQEVDKGGSLTGSAHRTWMDVKAMFSADNEESMLEEAIRGEKASVNEYDGYSKKLLCLLLETTKRAKRSHYAKSKINYFTQKFHKKRASTIQ